MTKHNKPAEDSTYLCVVIPKTVKDNLEEIAARFGGASVSSVVRSALQDYIIKHKNACDEVR